MNTFENLDLETYGHGYFDYKIIPGSGLIVLSSKKPILVNPGQAQDLNVVVSRHSSGEYKGFILALEEVKQLNSTGLGGIVSAYKTAKANNQRLVISNPSETIGRVFQTTQLNSVINIYSTIDEAVDSFTQ